MTGDDHLSHVEELQVRGLLAEHLLHGLHRVRALDLEPVLPAGPLGPCALHGALVTLQHDVVAARLRMELHPVVHRRATDDVESLPAQVSQNDVADDVAVVAARDELLRLVRLEALDAVDAEIRDELQCILALDVHVRHVIGLVEEHAGLLPCTLLVAPVRVLGRNDRVHVGTGLGVAQQIDGIAGLLDQVFQALRGGAHRRGSSGGEPAIFVRGIPAVKAGSLIGSICGVYGLFRAVDASQQAPLDPKLTEMDPVAQDRRPPGHRTLWIRNSPGRRSAFGR